eukprot:92013-Pyramimonas_sp.AAC.1
MAALIAGMGEIGWQLRHPDRWTDPDVNDWTYNPDDADLNSLFDAVHARVEADLWKQAGQHPEGLGCEQGGHLQATQCTLRWMRRKKFFKEA